MGEMYKPQNNGPHTTLAATINASQVSITVENANILPDAPNVLTIGTEEDAELVKLESKTGNILSVTRGFNGTTPKAWDSGAWIYRAITAQDIEELQERTKKIVKTLTAAEFEALTTEEKAALFASGVRVIAVEGDLDTDDNRYGYIINQDGTTAPLRDPHALHRGESVARAEVAANAEMLGGMLPSEFAKAGEGGITMELLWENATVATFPAQTIAVGLSECTHALLEITPGQSANDSKIYLLVAIGGTISSFDFVNVGAWADVIQIRTRNFQATSSAVIAGDGVVKAFDGKSNGSVENKTHRLLRIFGVKGVKE